jgi:YHS domain-containing protein
MKAQDKLQEFHMLKTLMIGVAFAGMPIAVSSTLAATAPISTAVFSRVAVSGYDVVSYHLDGKPVEGSKDFTAKLRGVEWRFASAAHRDAFKAKPEAYMPQYGGYCAWAVSQGYTAPSDPKAWKLVDGKLCLNYNADVQTKWAKDIAGNIAAANKNWPTILQK